MPRAATRVPWPWVLVFALAVAVSAFTIRRGIDPFDEGLALQAARRVADGELPYADFLWAYGPAQPYLLAALAELFDQSMLTWRIVRILVNGAVAVVVYALLRERAGLPLAAAGATVAATAMAQPLGANPFAGALLFALLAVAAAAAPGEDTPRWRRPLLAAALTALAAAWRLDFGIYAGAACLAALAVRGDLAALARYAATAVAAGLLVYLPFAAAAGPGDAWDALVARGLRDQDHWRLPFPLEYDGAFALWPPGTLLRGLDDLLEFYVPLLLLTGLVLVAAVALARRRALPPLLAGLLVLGAGFFLYLRTRPDAFHETPLLVTLAVLLPLAARRAPRPAAVAAVAILALLGAHTVGNRAVALVDPPRLEPLGLDVADGVRVEPGDAADIPPAVAAVRELVPPGEPIYVVTRRSDLVRIGNPLFYVLADRPNALDADFDLHTSADAQRRLVERLEAERPGAIVRWTDPDSARPEPNARGRSSGVRILDDYLVRAYRPYAIHGYYVVLEPAP